VAALSLSGPTVRFRDDVVEQFAGDLRQTATQMSERGFHHPLNPMD
jgi:DNA-binding IclR family transcriptional regulator